jgi:hypothetical protein
MKEIFQLIKSAPLSNNATPQDLSSFWNKVYNELEDGKSLSAIEQQDRALSPSRFLSETKVKSWGALCEKDCDLLQDAPKSFVMIVAASAIRCVSIIKELEPLKRKGKKIAKLFAKHLKIEDQKSFLSRNDCAFGVGTPGRLAQLAGEFEKYKEILLIVDSSAKDAKERTIWEVRETRKDLYKLVEMLPNNVQLAFL